MRLPANAPGLLSGALLLALGLLCGCASTPQASSERDAEAKQFITHPATATIYVYRDEWWEQDADSVLFVDGRIVGSTLPGGYFRMDVKPGTRVLHGLGYDQGRLAVEVRPGEIYFVALHLLQGTSRFAVRPPALGHPELMACCVLLENWAPGQRPLLR